MVLCAFYSPFPWFFAPFILPSHGPLRLLFSLPMVLCVFYSPFPWSFMSFILPSHGPLCLLFSLPMVLCAFYSPFPCSFASFISLLKLIYAYPTPFSVLKMCFLSKVKNVFSSKICSISSSYETSGFMISFNFRFTVVKQKQTWHMYAENNYTISYIINHPYDYYVVYTLCFGPRKYGCVTTSEM
jgi:hypothetical protein